MKKNITFQVLTVLCLFVVFTLLPASQVEAAAKKIKPGEMNSFRPVSKLLNEGGDFYMYMSTEKFIKFMQNVVGFVKGIALAETKEPEKKKEVDIVFKLADMLLKDSGLYEVSGVGMSSVTMANGLNHEKSVLHHYKGKGQGLIWNLSEARPHSFDSQKLLPANTAFASFSDNKLEYLWQWIQKEAQASGVPKIQQAVGMVKPMLMSKGIDIDATIKALGKRNGIILTLDKSKMCSIPVEKKLTFEIPDPALAMVYYVEDDSIFQLLQKFVPFQFSEENGVKKITGPILPLPITLNPMIVQKGNLLVIASNGKIADEILAATGGLLKTAEFKKLSAFMPTQGNSYTFMSEKIFGTMLAIQRQALAKAKPEEQEMFSSLERLNPFKNLTFYTVKENGPEGFITTSNNNLPLGGSALIPGVIAVGVVTAIAIPNLLTAMQKGKQKGTMGDMKEISMAIEAYITDNGQAPQGDSLAAIESELVPKYIQKLPINDKWEHPFVYRHGMDGDKKAYCIASGGKDGHFEGWEQNGYYVVKEVHGFGHDIILCNGSFVYGPKVK